MKLIPLTQGMFAMVDDADYDLLVQFNWYTHKGKNTYYARRNVMENGRKVKSMYMHREIMGAIKEQQIDHEDHDGLNCQRYNLREATPSQNASNGKSHKDSFSGFLGVSFDKQSNKWIASLMVNYKRVHLKRFYTELEAAISYNHAAIKHHGKFARINIVNRPSFSE